MADIFTSSLSNEDLLQHWSTQLQGEHATDSGALCIGVDGSIIVTDSMNRNIKVFQSDGSVKMVLGSKSRKISDGDDSATRGAPVQEAASPPLRHPLGVCTVQKDRVAVADSRANAIFVFHIADGTLQHTISDAAMRNPVAVQEHRKTKKLVVTTQTGKCFLLSGLDDNQGGTKEIQQGDTFENVSCCAVSAQSKLVISVKCAKCLKIADPSLTKWQTIDLNQNEVFKTQNGCSPSGVCFDADGFLYVGDVNNNRILVLDKKLNYVAELHTREWFQEAHRFSLEDELRMTLRGPRDIAVDREGNLVVLEQSGMVKIFRHKRNKGSTSCMLL